MSPNAIWWHSPNTMCPQVLLTHWRRCRQEAEAKCKTWYPLMRPVELSFDAHLQSWQHITVQLAHRSLDLAFCYRFPVNAVTLQLLQCVWIKSIPGEVVGTSTHPLSLYAVLSILCQTQQHILTTLVWSFRHVTDVVGLSVKVTFKTYICMQFLKIFIH